MLDADSEVLYKQFWLNKHDWFATNEAPPRTLNFKLEKALGEDPRARGIHLPLLIDNKLAIKVNNGYNALGSIDKPVSLRALLFGVPEVLWPGKEDSFAWTLLAYTKEFIRYKPDVLEFVDIIQTLLLTATPGANDRANYFSYYQGGGFRRWLFNQQRGQPVRCVWGPSVAKAMHQKGYFTDPSLTSARKKIQASNSIQKLTQLNRISLVELDDLYKTLTERYQNEQYPHPKWGDSETAPEVLLLIALCALSGARPAEIIKISEFTLPEPEAKVPRHLALVPKEHVIRQTFLAKSSDPNRSILRPILGGVTAAKFIQLHNLFGLLLNESDWLAKRFEDFGMAAPSRKLIPSESISLVADRAKALTSAWLPKGLDGLRSLRLIYGNYAWLKFGVETDMAQRLWLAKVLGHAEGDVRTSQYYSTLRIV